MASLNPVTTRDITESDPGEDEGWEDRLWVRFEEAERLRDGIKRLAALADDTSTEFFNGYLSEELEKLL